MAGEHGPIPASNDQSPPPRQWLVVRWLLGLLGTVTAIFWITGCMERLFYYPTSGPTPPPWQVPGTESVWFTSLDGTPLHAWFLPAKRDADDHTPAPSILHVHGNAGNIADHRWFTDHLPPAGFNVFLFDYRGYGESHGSPWNRARLIEDTNAALDCLLQRPDIDARRVGLYGQSLGGAIALNVMADRPKLRAAVIESPFASWRDMAASALGGDPPSLLARALAWLLIHDDHRPIDAIARIDRPILLLHGDADSVIPVTHSRRLKQAAGDNVKYIELHGGDHNTLRDSHHEIDGLTIDFLKRALENPAAPPLAP